MQKLIRGIAFTIAYNLSLNKNIVIDIYTLSNTRAQGLSFINIYCAIAISKFLKSYLTPLLSSIAIKGYDGKKGKEVTHFLKCTLVIDGRRLTKLPFLVLNLGNYDLILGSLWFEHYDVKPDMRRRRLVWPLALPSYPHFAQELKQVLSDLYAQELAVKSAEH